MSQVASYAFEMPTTPSDLQRAVCKFVMARAPLRNDASLTRYSIPGAPSDKYWVVSGQLKCATQAFLTLSLPEMSEKVFVGISDQCQEVFEQLVSSFNAKSECNEALTVGYAELVKSPKLNRYGWGGILVMEAQRTLKKLPRSAQVAHDAYELLQVVPITVSEFMIWRHAGYKGLLHHFKKTNRNLFHFHQKVDEYTNRLVPIKPKGEVARPSQNRSVGKTASIPQNAPQRPTPVSQQTSPIPQVAAQKTAAQQKTPTQQQQLAPQAPVQPGGRPKPIDDVATQLRKASEPALNKAVKAKSTAATTRVTAEGAKPSRRPTMTPGSADQHKAPFAKARAYHRPEHVSTAQNSDSFESDSSKPDPLVQAPARPSMPPQTGVYERPLSVANLSHDLAARKGLKRAVIESTVGTGLLVGGFVGTLTYVGSDSPAMGILPAVFTVAGLVTLASAFQEALAAGQRTHFETVYNSHS